MAEPALYVPDIWSVLPPVLAIGLAIATRQVFVSLFVGIWAGWTVLAGGDPLRGVVDAVEACIAVFKDAGNTRVIIFSAMVGALITFTQYSGGVEGFVDWIKRRNLVSTRRRALVMSWSLGVVIFIESSITSLVNGSVFRPVFDKMGISREKLAYLCDATAAPICVLIPLNAWGAYIAGLLEKEGFDAPVEIMVAAIPMNLYALGTLVFSFVVVAWMGKDFGPMRRAEARVQSGGGLLREGAEPVVAAEVIALEPHPTTPRRAINFVLPILVLVAAMPVGLYLTGDGNILKGSGSTSVLWAVILAIFTSGALSAIQGIAGLKKSTELFFKGFGGLMPLAVLMVLAFAIGATTKELHTGTFVAELARSGLPVALGPAALFVFASFIAFSTGTSWGTFAIMLPIGVPMAQALGIPAEVAIGAVLGGGVFGDHCSPISDTTLIASMAAGTDHMDHVNTQLPYALVVGGLTVVAYLVIGLLA